MANHAYVKTRKKMTPEAVTELLDRLNQTIFKGCLQVKYSKAKPGDNSWGPHVWVLTAVDDKGEEVGSRVCWLNTERSFEIRHGGGGNFIWWIDCAVCNEVAITFNGTWKDDGSEMKEKGTPGKYSRFRAFQRRMTGHFWGRRNAPKDKPWNAKLEILELWGRMQLEEKSIPPQFRQQNWRFLVKINFPKDFLKKFSYSLEYDRNPKYA